NFMMYRFTIMDAIWLGRYAMQHQYGIDRDSGRRRVVIERTRPIHGDKLAFRFDDGTGRHRDDEVGIRLGMSWSTGDKIAGDRKVEMTDGYGPAYFLEPWERRMICIHRHIIEDGVYEDPLSAGRIHGVGIRDRI